MTPTTQLIATVLSIIASFGVFAAWMLRHMDRQMGRRFGEVDRRFGEMDRRFGEMQQQFAELRTEMRQGFEQVREDRLRLERKMEDRFGVHGERIITLHQMVGRLQGVVERTHEPERFTVRSAAPELSAGVEVREPRASYDVGSGGEEAGRGGRKAESGGGDSAPAGGGAGQGDDP